MSRSRIEDVVGGQLAWTEVDLLNIEDGSALSVRGVLEEFGVRVNYFPIGQPRHVLAALGGARPVAPYVIICCHGEDGRILLPELADSIAAEQPFTDRMGPKRVRRHLRVPGSAVISTGCDTGKPALAQAFLDSGAAAYFAPTGAPGGHTALLAVLLLFYELTAGRPLRDAAHRVRGYNDELAMWKLWER
ncbi:hypothetical protein NDR87_06935 [Nocardia sp. CDC159]|uniref:Uncharacterized protein n=1 Tax=Nocardia pulmonis TaxID=2951408 RepID=A0A9X2E2R9_9NOCA|nr:MULTISPECIES: hypothetical protein [Nocardia]MCM6773202.1 hypothetical protein [Nocardia pulmonis]MCM6786089.1 hypothetical protein [Nocardia sp. CDC159]